MRVNIYHGSALVAWIELPRARDAWRAARAYVRELGCGPVTYERPAGRVSMSCGAYRAVTERRVAVVRRVAEVA